MKNAQGVKEKESGSQKSMADQAQKARLEGDLPSVPCPRVGARGEARAVLVSPALLACSPVR